MTELEQNQLEKLEKAVINALRSKVAAEAAFDTTTAALFAAEYANLAAEKTYYKSDDSVDRAKRKYLKKQQDIEARNREKYKKEQDNAT